MEPIRLKLENFGPYESTEIDFYKYYTHTLFLISGKTGAGKTTIFDGMMYALYGTTSGGLREGREMRSNFSDPSQQTRVTFEFKQNNQTYIIERKPDQLVKKISGEGFKNQKHAVSLTVLDKDKKEINQITKVPDVNKFVENLIGLSRDQFSQIVMLPQGEFRRFLNADSNSKEIILRKLFNTYFYKDIAQILKDKKKQEEAKFKGMDHNLIAEMNQLVWEDEWQERLVNEKNISVLLEMYEEQNQKYEELVMAEEIKLTKTQEKLNETQHLLKKQEKLADYFTEKKKVEEQLADLKQIEQDVQEKKEHATLLKEIGKIAPVVATWNTLKKDRSIRQEKISTQEIQKSNKEKEHLLLEKQLVDIMAKKEIVAEKEKQLEKIMESIPLFEDCKKIEKSIKKIQTDIDKEIVGQQKMEQQYGEVKQSKEVITSNLVKETELILKQAASKEALRATLDKIKVIETYESLLERKQLLANQVIRLNEDVLESRNLLEKLEIEFKLLESDWAKAQIAKLSLKLVEGEPCLVCGSTTHPNPKESSHLTAEDIEILESKLEKKEEAKNKVKEKITALESQISYKEETYTEEERSVEKIKKQIYDFFDSESDETTWQSLVRKEQLITETELRKTEILLKEITEQKEEEVKLNQLEGTLLAEIERYNIMLRELNNQLIEATTNHKNIIKQLPTEWSNLDEMLLKQQELIKEIGEWQDLKNKTEEELTHLTLELTSLGSTLESNLHELKEITVKINDSNNKIANFLVEVSIERSLLDEMISQLSQLDDIQQEIINYEQKYHTLATRQKELIHLINNQEEPTIAPLLLQQKMLSGELEVNRNSLVKLEMTVSKNNDVVSKVTRELSSKRIAQERLLELTELADTLTGDGPNKLSIERFVLQMYLKKILQRGNEKLVTLTNGRYRFEIKEEQGSSKKATGLEINIFDDNVGAIRSVNTLSGGESFIAALSLALSLAEIIQEEAGGVTISAMFIDEGFGSLDEDALEMAIRALENIEGEGRIIGIISHVRELKERIPQQLHIVSENGKSSVKHDESSNRK